VQDAQSDACGKSNFSVVTPKTISSNYQINNPNGIIKDSTGNVLISSNSNSGADCFSTVSVINPNTYGLSKVIKVDGYEVYGMTLDSYGNIWALGYPLCKGGRVGGTPIESLLKINVASGQVIYKVSLYSLPNAGKLSLNWAGNLSSDSKGNLYLVANDSSYKQNLIRLSATDGTLLENYNSFLPLPESGYYSMNFTIDSKGYLWAATDTVDSNGSWKTTYTVIDPLKSTSDQVGAVLDTYNNLPATVGSFPVVDYAHNSVYVSVWKGKEDPFNQVDQYQINMSTHNQVSILKNVGGGDLGQSILDSNKNIWFLNNGSNVYRGSCDSPCTTNPNYIPSSLTFIKGSTNNALVYDNSSLGLYSPLGAIQSGNNLWVLNLGPYDTTNQVYLPSITIMNVNTQSLVKVLYNHQ
jgi:hypothetical protein